MSLSLDPALLFFAFGLLAAALRSNLEIPPAISRFLSLYLLMALGLKGGFSLAKSGLNAEVLASLAAAVLLAVVVPLLGYALLRKCLPALDAAALAATCGAVSAVTFVTAVQYLETHQIAYGGHMAAALALMESPAIILAVLLAHRWRRQAQTRAAQASAASPQGHSWRESLTDGAQLLLLGSMAIGWLTGERGQAVMQPFAGDLFKGLLSFFLLDMGLLAARQAASLKGLSPWVLAYAVLGPLLHAGLALGLAKLLALPVGDGALLTVLAASASYIAVPAALRQAIPEARPSIYLGLSLGVTFPLNLMLGLPLYVGLAQAWL
jgi:hypothetical protein